MAVSKVPLVGRYHYRYHILVARGIKDIVADMEAGKQVRFGDLAKVCDHYFGQPRQKSTSHHVYKVPWPGDPRVNIQNEKGNAKAYQVRQVLKAIAKLKEEQS